MPYQPGGSAVPYAQQGVGNLNANRTQSYGAGLGGIYQYGRANPYGPYSGVARAGQSPGINPAGGSRTTASSGPGGGEDFLRGVVGGQNLPFSPFTQNQMMGQQADMTAAAESANLQQLNEDAAVGGASANDPSLQSGRRQLQSTRQNQNLQAQRAISAQAGQANFGAQMDAARALQQAQMTREGWGQQSQLAALGFMPWNQPGSGQPRQQSYINFLGF